MYSTVNENIGRKRFSSDRSLSDASELYWQSCSDDDQLIEDLIRQRIRSIEADLFAEYCSELPKSQVEQLCSRR